MSQILVLIAFCRGCTGEGVKLDNMGFSRVKGKGKGDVGVGAGVSCSQQVLNKYMEKEEFPKSGALRKEALAGCSKAVLGGEGSAKESHDVGAFPPSLLSSLLPFLHH